MSQASLCAAFTTAALLIACADGTTVAGRQRPISEAGCRAQQPAPTHRLDLHHALMMEAPAARPETIVLGDSIAAGWPVGPQEAGAVLNLGVPGDATKQILWRLPQYALSNARPKRVILIAGTNDLSAGVAPQVIACNIESIVAKLRGMFPTTKIAIFAVLPRGVHFTDYDQQRRKLNDILQGTALRGQATFVDPGPALACRSKMPCSNYKPGNLHLTASGYAILELALERARRTS